MAHEDDRRQRYESDEVFALRLRVKALEVKVRRLEEERLLTAALAPDMTPFEKAVIEMHDRVKILSAQVAELRGGIDE